MNFNLKLMLRRLLKEKTFSLINVLGLGVGIACFLLIALYLQNELSYDQHFANAKRIYRLSVSITAKDGTPDIILATNAPNVAPLLQQDFPQDIEAAARLAAWKPAVQVEQGNVSYVDAVFADNSVFSIFDFSWLAGDAATALQEPDSAVLTASTALKLFGTSNAAGKRLTLPDNHDVKITGVIADLPGATHLKFDMLVPIALTAGVYGPKALENWFTMNYHTYVLLKQGADINTLPRQFPAFFERHLDAEAAKVFSMEPMLLTDVHLHSNRRGELRTPGSMVAVSAFSLIAVIVLLVACINFMNLATAKAAHRMREAGIRKVAGASKTSLVLQYLGEAVLMTGMATVIALVCVELALPVFSAIVQRELALNVFGTALGLPFLLLLVLVVGVCAGSYPAFYISACKPAAIFRGQIAGGKRGAWLRNALVVVQFSVAIVLLISVATLYLQVQFARNMPSGYDKEQVVVLSNLGREGVGRQWDSMRRELLSNPGIREVTAANSVPTRDVDSVYNINYEGGSERRGMPTMLVDSGFFETFGIKLLSGRFFSGVEALDRRAAIAPGGTQSGGTYIVSEEAARQMHWSPEQAIGKWLEVTCCGMGQGRIVGVVKDVQYSSIHVAKGPVIYLVPPEPEAFISGETRLGLRDIAIKLSGNNLPEALAHIDSTWTRFRPNQPITRHFLSDDFKLLYQAEERQGRMLIAFALLAIVITSLGLYGLSCYNAERRTKEIGVRKVMGGSVWSIVVLLTNDFSKLVLLANVVAWPVAYFAMDRWLQNFAYRIDLTPLVFIGSGLIALCIAWATVGGTAAKAASQKPVLALRYE